MSLNNQMYRLFTEMVKSYNAGDVGGVEQYARCWIQLAPENPFTYDTPEYEEFFQMQKCYMIWFKGAIDQKINRRKMIQHAQALCALNPQNPYKFDKEEARRELEEKRNKEAMEIKRIEESKKAERQNQKEKLENVQFVLFQMTQAYNQGDENAFRSHVTHLMDMNAECPFKIGSPEHLNYIEMVEAYEKHNMRRVIVVAKDLCEIINKTEPKKKEQKVILGILPDEEKGKEKKSWFKFLNPRKKDGE